MLVSSLFAFLVACGTPSAEPAPEAPTVAATAPDATAPAPDATCLEHADLMDGTDDNVIHRCANCGLGMDGDETFASTVGDYTAHACSASCKELFDADPATVLARACKH